MVLRSVLLIYVTKNVIKYKYPPKKKYIINFQTKKKTKKICTASYNKPYANEMYISQIIAELAYRKEKY